MNQSMYELFLQYPLDQIEEFFGKVIDGKKESNNDKSNHYKNVSLQFSNPDLSGEWIRSEDWIFTIFSKKMKDSDDEFIECFFKFSFCVFPNSGKKYNLQFLPELSKLSNGMISHSIGDSIPIWIKSYFESEDSRVSRWKSIIQSISHSIVFDPLFQNMTSDNKNDFLNEILLQINKN